jgi:uroporphyrinogen decarboxylase
MTTRLDHSDRLRALREGITPDRPPVALWRHFYKDEDDLDNFVEAMVGWQRQYDWDFLKINPRASYHYEPWGVVMRPSPDQETKPERIRFPIQHPNDWQKISVLPATHPLFDFQLRAVSRIRKLLPPPFPLVMTVFNPISIIGDMVPSEEVLISHLHDCPDFVQAALGAITTTFTKLVHEFRNAGADGLFFATTQWASQDRLTLEELERLVLPHDRAVWAAAGTEAFNVLHVCDRNIHLGAYRDFAAALVNWDVALPGNPTLHEGHDLLQRPVLGGIHHETDLQRDTPDATLERTKRLIADNRDLPFAVGPGCAIPVTTPHENVAAVRAAVDAG